MMQDGLTLIACFWNFCKSASSLITTANAFFSALASSLIILDKRLPSLAADDQSLHNSMT